jgi:hypothetical protein
MCSACAGHTQGVCRARASRNAEHMQGACRARAGPVQDTYRAHAGHTQGTCCRAHAAGRVRAPHGEQQLVARVHVVESASQADVLEERPRRLGLGRGQIVGADDLGSLGGWRGGARLAAQPDEAQQPEALALPRLVDRRQLVVGAVRAQQRLELGSVRTAAGQEHAHVERRVARLRDLLVDKLQTRRRLREAERAPVAAKQHVEPLLDGTGGGAQQWAVGGLAVDAELEETAIGALHPNAARYQTTAYLGAGGGKRGTTGILEHATCTRSVRPRSVTPSPQGRAAFWGPGRPHHRHARPCEL